MISEACVPPVCAYDGDSTSDILVSNLNSQETTIWVDSSSVVNVNAKVKK